MNQMESDSTEQPSKASGPHILLVDDEVEIVESMRYALEGAGFQVSVARDGNQGLAMAETLVPDLMVLDMMMPKRSGFLVMEQLRRDGSNRIKVIMITGNEGNRHQQYAELLGVDEYLRKPFPMDKLIESARRLTSTGSNA
jgi:DNA-binding response OmpR family regulator